MRNLKFGGTLEIGDFIAISDGNHISFGWYCGDGLGTLQYYQYGTPRNAYEQYQEFVNNPDAMKSQYWTKKFEKGFTRKCLWKAYINAVHSTRVMKITHPEEIFTEQEDRDRYEKSKEAMILLNLIKK
jgi:hypothetical protein